MSEKRRDEAVMELSSTIMQQMNSDPLLPRANPTVSPWQVPAHPSVANVQSPELPDMTDYVVIGSGITACGVVKTLLSSTSISSNKTVTVFEARQLCSSATGRNGGQLTRVPLARHAQLVKQLGADQANKVVRLTLKTLQEMHKLAEAQTPELERDCRHQRLEKFYAYYDEKLFEDAKKLVEFCETHIPEERGMIKIVSREECCKLHGLNRAVGGFRFPAGVTSPYRLVTNVFQSLLDKYGDRLSIETNTPITNMQYQPETNVGYPYIVTTPRGHSRAATIIHCTNGHAGHLLPGLRGAIYPARGIMSLHSPGNKFPDRSHTQSWSYFVRPWYDRKSDTVERGHYYAHQHPGTKQLWVRGHLDSVAGYITSDDTEVDNAAATNIVRALPRFFNEKWINPAECRMETVWSGIMANTADSLPFVGRLPHSATGRMGTGEWISAGYNSYGMTNGLLCGTAVAEMALGNDVGAWFPEVYLVNEERLRGPMFQKENMTEEYLKRCMSITGIKDINAKL